MTLNCNIPDIVSERSQVDLQKIKLDSLDIHILWISQNVLRSNSDLDFEQAIGWT